MVKKRKIHIWVLPISLSFLILGIIFTKPTTKISFYSISACFISYVIYKKTKALAQGNITLRMIVLSPLLQFIWIAIYFLIGGSSIIPNIFMIDVAASPFKMISALLVLPMCALFVAYLFNKLSVRPAPLDISPRKITDDRCFEILLIISAFYLIFYRIAVMRLPLLSTTLHFLYLGLTFVPFLIGYFSFQYKRPVKIFILVYVFSSILAFAEGSRSHLFIPPALFFFGYIQHVSLRKMIILSTIVVLLAPLILTISASIEDVRQYVRINREYSTISSDIGTISKNMFNFAKNDMLAGVQKGIGRLIVWSNLAVLTMSPDPIPFRGFSDFLDEINWRFRFSFLNPSSAEDEATYDFGIGAANIYGFGVVHGGTVPFPILADAWSRGGLLYTLFSGTLICLLLGIIEKFARVSFYQSHYISIFFITILASIAFETASIYSLLYTIKFLFLSTLVWFILFKAYLIIFNAFHPGQAGMRV
jgi:hypothetical protein